ncbi:MAG: ATP-binding protein [Haloferacaceae archaeon]
MTDIEAATYRAAFEATGLPVLIADAELVVRDATPAAATTLGVDADALLGRAVTDFLDAAGTAAVRDHFARGDEWHGRFTLATDETAVRCRGTAAPVVRDGDTVGCCLAFVDVTARRRYEDASAVLGRLLRHDLRNDLNLVLGYVELAADRTDDPEVGAALGDAREVVDDIVAKANRARDLRDLLDRADDATLRPVRLDTLLVDRLVDLVGEYPDARIDWGAFPAVEVAADDLLARVVDALVENAVEHNDDEPTVEVSVEADDRTARLRVADDGPGIPLDREDVVLGRTSGDPLNHGTGISLFFVDRVVDSYDGTVSIERSRLGGAAFVVELQRV